jgi:RNA polymerase sigma-70 factor (ECF subfamily)
MISRQTAINKYKAKNRDKRGGGRMDVVLDELTFCLHDKNEHDIVDRIHLGNVLNAFLSDISKKNRIIFIRRYWYMDSIENIARVMGMTKSGVKMSLLRSRAKLKKYLKEEGIEV